MKVCAVSGRQQDRNVKAVRRPEDFRMLSAALLLLLFSVLPLRSVPYRWHPEVLHYSSRNGLPTSMIFKVLEDRQGYIWLGTNHGAIRYDGHAFHSYTTRDGLLDNTVIDIAEDSRGRLWFLTLSRRISYFAGGQIHPFRCNDLLENTLPQRPSKIFFEENGNIWLTPLQPDKVYMCGQDTIQEVNWRNDPLLGNGNYYCRRLGKNWMTVTTLEPPVPNVPCLAASASDRYALSLPQTGPETLYNSMRLDDGRILVWDSFRFLLITGDGSVVTLRNSPEGNFNSVTVDVAGDIWLITKDGALRYAQGKLEGEVPEHFLPGVFLTSVLRDRAGNYWFASWNKGLFLVPGAGFRTLRFEGVSSDNAFSSVKVFDDQLWFLNTSGSIFSLKDGFVPDEVIDGEDVLGPNPESVDFLKDVSGRFWVGQNVRLVTPEQNGRYRVAKTQVAAAKIFLPLKNGNIAVGTANGVQICDADGVRQYSLEKLSGAFAERTNALCETDDGTLWIGTISGLYRYRDGTLHDEGAGAPLLQNRVIEVTATHGGTLVLATRGAGLLLKHGAEVYQINSDSGLTSDIVRSVFVDTDGTIWAGTNAGLNRIRIAGFSPLRFDILTWTTGKGLPSNGINCIMRYRENLWLATDDGLCRFNPDLITINRLPLPVYITSLTVNGEEAAIGEEPNLAWDRNNLTFSFIGLGFRAFQDTRYRYRLLGLGADTAWHETVNRNIPFFSLAPGAYTFQVSAANEDGIWNPVPDELHFRIAPHFTQTLWFIVGSALLGIMVVGGIVWNLLHRMHRRNAVAMQISELRHHALRANMNPHFISNSLSVIQDYMLHHNSVDANTFLTRFSRLIRLTLETSQNSFASLGAELERLDLYLALERMRFGEKLEYAIDVAGVDPDDIPVPSMLIQPYVENAIWHGILPSGRPGKIAIEVAMAGQEQYTITIRDNGVGLAAGEHRKQSGRTSFSMAHNRERLRLLSRSLRQPFSVHVSGGTDESGHPCGTVVVISLPTVLPGIDF